MCDYDCTAFEFLMVVHFRGKCNYVRIRSMSKSSTWTFDHKNALKSFNSIINMNFEQHTIQSILTYHRNRCINSNDHFCMKSWSFVAYTYLIESPIWKFIQSSRWHSIWHFIWLFCASGIYPHYNGHSPIALILGNL
jgi:hypothetical protein